MNFIRNMCWEITPSKLLHRMSLMGQWHDDVIKWKHFPRYWPFLWQIHWSLVNSPQKGQWRGALMFSLTYTRTSNWVHNRGAGDLRRHRAHYDVTVMSWICFVPNFIHFPGINELTTFPFLPQVAGFFAVMWSLSLLSYLFSHHIGIPVFANPLCLVGFCILFIVNPIKVLNYKARMWLLRVMVSFWEMGKWFTGLYENHRAFALSGIVYWFPWQPGSFWPIRKWFTGFHGNFGAFSISKILRNI